MLAKFLKAGFGGAGAQLVNFITLPVLSRLYPPEEYGVWAIVFATSSIFGAVACLRYELAIVLPKSDEEASSILWWCLFSSCGMGIFVMFLLFIPHTSGILAGKSAGSIWAFGWIIPCLVATIGYNLSLQYWCVRNQAFAVNSLSLIIRATSTIFLQILLAVYFAASAANLLLGSLVGQLCSAGVLVAGIFWAGDFPKLSASVLRQIPQILKRHKRFFFYSTPYKIFGVLRDRASLYILDAFATQRDVGLYAFAYRILYFPVMLVSGALRPVLFQETASKGVPAVEERISLILKGMAILATPFVILFCQYSEEIFSAVFGDKWTGAGFMSLFLIWPAFTFLFCNWMDRILDVLGKQHLALILEVVFATASLSALWLGFWMEFGLMTALLFQVAVLTLYNIVYLYIAYDRAAFDKRELAKLLLMVLLLGTTCWIALSALTTTLPMWWAIAVYVASCLSCLLAVGIYKHKYLIEKFA